MIFIFGCEEQDGKYAHGETVKKAMDALRDKIFCDMPEEKRIEKFIEETDPKKTYPARYFYDWHHRLTGSCETAGRRTCLPGQCCVRSRIQTGKWRSRCE